MKNRDKPVPIAPEESPRERILAAAEEIIAQSGIAAVTTRAVAAAAGVQAPAIYRLFGDKEGLLDALTEHVMHVYVSQKSQHIPGPDPVEELRAGWDEHVNFAFRHPSIFIIMASSTGPARDTPSMRLGFLLLQDKILALATAGRLKLPEERALHLFSSLATGTILTLLKQPIAERDLNLSREAREAAISAITGESSQEVASGERGAALALRARLPQIGGLSDGERLLLSELLERIAEHNA